MGSFVLASSALASSSWKSWGGHIDIRAAGGKLSFEAARKGELSALRSVFLGPTLRAARCRVEGRKVQRKETMAVLALPENFGYVVLTIVAGTLLTQWQAIQVGRQRKLYNVQYPKMYEDAERSVFNCYQRAHQNTLENFPSFLVLLLVAGIGYPITASICGMVWVVGRVVYSLGYYTGNPKNRMRGMWNFFGLIGLLVTSVVFGLQHISFPKLF